MGPWAPLICHILRCIWYGMRKSHYNSPLALLKIPLYLLCLPICYFLFLFWIRFWFYQDLLFSSRRSSNMNRIRDLVQTIFAQGQSSERDTEQGKSQPSPTFTSTCTPELALFRHLTGITSELSYSAVGNKPGERQGGSNVGIYPQVVMNEDSAKREYKKFPG